MWPWVLLLVAGILAIIATVVIWHLAENARKQECLDSGGRVVEVQGNTRAFKEWVCL